MSHSSDTELPAPVFLSTPSSLPRQAMVTGGQGDLAREIVTELERQGYQLKAPGKDRLNLADQNSIHHYFKTTDFSDGLDLLICNASITRDKAFFHLTDQDFSEVLEVNLNGHYQVAKQALKIMSKSRQGHVIFISSFAAYHGTAGQSAYASSKAALHGLALSLAQEYGLRNIRVNIIMPGFLETKMTASLNASQRQAFSAAHALPHFNTITQVAKFISFLDQELPFTSGQIFNLDSRLHRWS